MLRRSNLILILFVLALIVLAFWYLKKIILYVCVAAVLSMIAQPLLTQLERIRIRRKKLPRALRAFLALFTIYLVVFAFVAIFIPLAVKEARIISNVDRAQLSKALHEPVSQIEHLFQQFQQSSGKKESLEEYVQQAFGEVLNSANISAMANSIAGMLGSVFIGFFAISFLTFFFLRDGPLVLDTLLLLVPPKHEKAVRHILEDTQRLLTKYFTGVLIDMLFVAAFISIGMAVFGVQNAIIIGLFAGVMNMIPYVGTIISWSFAVVVAVSSNLTLDFYSGMVPLLIEISLVFVAMNLVDGFIVQPYIFSNSVKAHPLEIFLVILIAGTLGGILGMILAVPLYTIVRVVAKEFLGRFRFVQRLTDELDETETSEKL